MKETDMFVLVKRAQNGDQDSMNQIIRFFRPVIRSVVLKARLQDHKDVEQTLSERIIRAVQSYDLNSIPDFSTFCKQVCEKQTIVPL